MAAIMLAEMLGYTARAEVQDLCCAALGSPTGVVLSKVRCAGTGAALRYNTRAVLRQVLC